MRDALVRDRPPGQMRGAEHEVKRLVDTALGLSLLQTGPEETGDAQRAGGALTERHQGLRGTHSILSS